ncbi:MAG: hypothetical protein WCQ99_11810 [Pseudomonadota bacterium]
MKMKNYLSTLLLVLMTAVLTTCDIINPDPEIEYAAKAREIVDDLYVFDGTQEDAYKAANLSDHFDTILEVLGIQKVDDPQEVTAESPVSLISDQVELITDGIFLELFSKIYLGVNESLKSYYQPEDIVEFLNSSDIQIERESGYGPITADDLKGVMDYYTQLYDNNATIEREYFAGYLIGAISRKNPDIGTLVDEYSLDKLQFFLFMLDAFTLPTDSPLAASVKSVSGNKQIAAAAAGSSQSSWGAGAKKMNIKPSDKKQKVIDILENEIKTYTYTFSLTGPQSIYCGEWEYTVSVMRTCTTEEITSEELLAPLPNLKVDCSGSPQPVAGINIKSGGKLQEHFTYNCNDDSDLAPLFFATKSDGTNCFNAVCSRKCPVGTEKSHIPGTNNVNGYVYATFSGTDKDVVNNKLKGYTLIPVTMYLNVTERVGDKIECHKN